MPVAAAGRRASPARGAHRRPRRRPPPRPGRPGFASRAAGFFSGIGKLSPSYLAAAGFAGLLVVAAIVYFATSGGGGGGSDCKPVDTTAAAAGRRPDDEAGRGRAPPRRPDCAPSGQITLARSQQTPEQSKSQAPTFVLQANAVHLQPTASDDRYLLWLYKSDSQSVPLGQESVDDDGNLTGAVPSPTQELVLFPAFDHDPARAGHHRPGAAGPAVAGPSAKGKKPSLLVRLRRNHGARRADVSELRPAAALQARARAASQQAQQQQRRTRQPWR